MLLFRCRVQRLFCSPIRSARLGCGSVSPPCPNPGPSNPLPGNVPRVCSLRRARLRVFLRHALLTPNLDPRTRYQRFIAAVAQTVRFPFATMEGVRHNAAIRRHRLSAPPIFLVGHWAQRHDPSPQPDEPGSQFGFLKFSETAMPLDMLGPLLPFACRRIEKALARDPGLRQGQTRPRRTTGGGDGAGEPPGPRILRGLSFPHRHGGAARPRTMFFEGLSESELRRFRREYESLVRKVAYVKHGNAPSSKTRPRRLGWACSSSFFPTAKFIHIVRNPWPVFSSTCGKFPRVYSAFAWQPFQDVDIPASSSRPMKR